MIRCSFFPSPITARASRLVKKTKCSRNFIAVRGTRPGGLGLGLSIARQLVEAHGGQIVAQNREDGGARFSIRLPIGEPMRLPTGRRPHETGRAHHRRRSADSPAPARRARRRRTIRCTKPRPVSKDWSKSPIASRPSFCSISACPTWMASKS